MFWLFICFACIYFIVNGQQFVVPPCDESYNCISSLAQSDCLRNEFLEIDWNRSCCPVCRGGLGFGVAGCNPTNVRRRCAPGLLCRNATCVLDKDLCSYTYHLKHLKNLPSCELDGSFASKQCFGDMVSGRCFCSDELGNRIFGFDWRSRSANMTCACSRQRVKLEKYEGRLDVTLHCDRNGNYERLQCDSGICWCAEPTTGLIAYNSRAVPAAMWKALPCYEKEMGDEYMRQCESAAFAQNIRRTALAKRGTLDVSFNNIQCDYDGSFGRYKIESGIASCVWRDGKRIGSYQDSARTVSTMNCYCARDQKIFEEAGLSFTLSCAGNGNYDDVQGMNGRIFCVDPNGYPLTDYLASVFGLDCNQYLYSKVTEPLDDDDDDYD